MRTYAFACEEHVPKREYMAKKCCTRPCVQPWANSFWVPKVIGIPVVEKLSSLINCPPDPLCPRKQWRHSIFLLNPLYSAAEEKTDPRNVSALASLVHPIMLT